MSSAPNDWCRALGIPRPRLEEARKSPDANTYSLLIVALLERGTALTLAEAAQRFEEAGIAPAERALLSLKRCKPGRPPIYREGDLYALDPHDAGTDLWAFRLGLRPAKVPSLRIVRSGPGPLPGLDAPISAEALHETWQWGIPSDWSAQRMAICVLDAYGGDDAAMQPDEVLAHVQKARGGGRLSVDSARTWRRGAAIRVRSDGCWQLDRAHDAVRSAREAVRARVATARREVASRPDPAVQEANRRYVERRRRAHAEQLAGMRRALLHAFPAKRPEALVLLDVERRELTTLIGDETATAGERLAPYEILAAMDVRALLRALDIDARRLAELGPPQKSRTLNKRGRTLRITTPLLIQGSCGIARPLGDKARLRAYLRNGEHTKLRRRLEADAKALFAYYQYGRLHGTVRLRWGFLDEWIPAPWVHRDEPTLHHLMAQAHAQQAPLEVVTGSAPGWADPWARARRAWVVKEEPPGWRMGLVDEEGREIDRGEVQAARSLERG